jgi:hypothetical protein
VAAIDPQPFRHHPLPQRLDADPQTVTCNQFFRRQRGSEVDVMVAHKAQHRGPEGGLATLAVARPAALARCQTGRAIRGKCPAEAVNLTPTQPINVAAASTVSRPSARSIITRSRVSSRSLIWITAAIARHLERSGGNVPQRHFYRGRV